MFNQLNSISSNPVDKALDRLQKLKRSIEAPYALEVKFERAVGCEKCVIKLTETSLCSKAVLYKCKIDLTQAEALYRLSVAEEMLCKRLNVKVAA